MKLKILFLSVTLFATPAWALKFSYDNYSDIPLLKYSFSFNDKDWFESDDTKALAPKGFKTIEFGDSLPISWAISAPAGKTLSCITQGDHEKKPVKNIVTLNSPSAAKKNDLLLDIIDTNNRGSFLAGITDLDGERQYSNFIECTIY